jgi:hypothetical protein
VRFALLALLLWASCRTVDRSEYKHELDLTRPGATRTFVIDFADWDPRRGAAYVMLDAVNPQDRERKSLRLSLRAADITNEGQVRVVFEQTIEGISPWTRQYIGTLDVGGRKLQWSATVLEAHSDLARASLLFVGRGDEH